MTTNGFFFAQKAKALRDAGLQRISFSMDSLDRENFKKITGRDSLQEVLDGIDMAHQLGFNPVKVNAVMIKASTITKSKPWPSLLRKTTLLSFHRVHAT